MFALLSIKILARRKPAFKPVFVIAAEVKNNHGFIKPKMRSNKAGLSSQRIDRRTRGITHRYVLIIAQPPRLPLYAFNAWRITHQIPVE